MLELQKYLLSGNSVEDLEKEFGIYSYTHPELPLVGFKYGLIQSDKIKFHPIVRQCRGIVLERDSWDIVAYPFNRFFNLGEDTLCEAKFNWDNFTCQEKLDGSLIIVYYYRDSWRVNTSGSFAQGVCYESGVTWEELFWEVSKIDRVSLIKGHTYIFELWTKYNKIVRSYEEPFVKLLAVRDREYNEIPSWGLRHESYCLRVARPITFGCRDILEVKDLLQQYEKEDPTFEGFVLCDKNFNRIKVKTDSYKQLHRLKGNGQFIYRNIIPQLLKGNFSKLARDFPEWLEELECCAQEINRLKEETEYIWNITSFIKERKEFAFRVIITATLPSLLFYLKDGKFDSVEDAFSRSESLLIKYFEGKK